MELSLLRALRSMKKIEEDALFQTETIDPATFQPMHPNVIYVDQNLCDKFKGEKNMGKDQLLYVTESQDTSGMTLKTDQLTKAFLVATEVLKTFRWTIILEEGLYIDPLFLNWPSEMPTGASFEIVGLNDVRILYLSDGPFEHRRHPINDGHLTMRNIRLYDCRSNAYRNIPLFSFLSAARVEFIDVKISVPDIICLLVGQGASVRLKGCAFYEGLVPIQIDGGNARMEDCVFTRCGTEIFRTTGLSHGGNLSATRNRYVDCSKIIAWHRSHIVFTECRFEVGISRFMFDVPGPNPPLEKLDVDNYFLKIGSGATVECFDCEFRGYQAVTQLRGSDSNLYLKGCKISVVSGVADILENASIEIIDCHIEQAPFIWSNGCNVKGKASILRTTLGANVERPVFLTDLMSGNPKHDFKNARNLRCKYSVTRADDKERSGYTHAFMEVRMNAPEDKAAPVFNDWMMKSCELCNEPEGQENVDALNTDNPVLKKPPKKFQFCADCRQACYCSKVCQVKHWPDHKLSCTRRAVNK